MNKQPISSALDSRQVSLCMQMKNATEPAGNDDLSRFAMPAGKSNQKEYEMVNEEVDVQKENAEQS